jgi:hypothetical protein
VGYLRIKPDDIREGFLPGETISGVAEWQMEQLEESLEIRLFWYTSGKGTQDVEIVNTINISPVTRDGRQNFAFALPESPYSFSGQLISLTWAIEFVAQPSGMVDRIDPIVVAPNRKEIQLTAHETQSQPV